VGRCRPPALLAGSGAEAAGDQLIPLKHVSAADVKKSFERWRGGK
jgi:hypothetical protein